MIHVNKVGEWRLDGNANDTSGAGLTGTPTNVTYAAGPTGIPAGSQVGVFDGASSEVELPSAIIPTTADFAAGAWLQHGATEGFANQGIIGQWASGETGRFILLWSGVGNTISLNTGGSNRIISGALNRGQWYHAMVTRAGNVFSLYVDAILIGTETLDITLSSANPTFIGSFGINNTWFLGNISRVQIYNAALSASDVRRVKDGWNPIGRA